MKIGYCLTGSFCTFSRAFKTVKSLVDSGHEVYPIVSENVYSTDTRFYNSLEVIDILEKITGNTVIHTIKDSEPIGPQKMFDVLCVAPCTSNTAAKLALGITDTSVTMAVKSHLRNNRPVVIGLSTNDALGACAKNIGILRNYKNYYFVPLSMDDPINKPKSMVCDFDSIGLTIENAVKGIDMNKKIY